MNLDLIRFLPDSAELFLKLKNENVIVLNHSKGQVPKNSAVKFYSCAGLSKIEGNDFKNAKKNFDFAAVEGNNLEMCSWAANQKANLLIQPFGSNKNLIDSQTANVLCQNNVSVAFLFSEFLQGSSKRQMLIKNASQCIKVLKGSDVNILFFSGAKDEFELRAVKDLASFGVLLGLSQHDSFKIVRENPQKFLEGLK